MQIGKDIERYDWYYDPELFTEVIVDRLKSEQYRNSTRICELLNQQDQRIAEIEEQLKNAIVPKFKIMEKVWHINKDYFYKKDWHIEELLINGFEYKIDKRKNALVMWYSTYFNNHKNYKYQEKDLFATKEEAQAKLEELQGE